ncbi:hypothetical protein ACNF33_13855, partial [Staphylococcus aureus]
MKHLIQDKIDNGEVTIDNHKGNNDHTAFTEPFSKPGKEDSSSQPNMGAIKDAHGLGIRGVSATGRAFWEALAPVADSVLTVPER